MPAHRTTPEFEEPTDGIGGRSPPNYRIRRQLGAGGMGVAYLAEDTRLRRDVVLKTLLPDTARDPIHKKRLLREARAAAGLHHPNICTIHTIEESGDEAFVVMEFVSGATLDRLVSEEPLPVEIVIRIAVQLADALDYAHRNHVIHRDIKPSNIIVTEDHHAKILDFGLAKHLLPEEENPASQLITVSEPLTGRGQTPGTVAYMSPEQILGRELDGGTDLFSLGLVLYELCTGFHPFRRHGKLPTAAAILSQEAPPLGLPDGPSSAHLERVIQKCLSKKRRDRYRSGAALLSDLRHQMDLHLPIPSRGGARTSIAVLPFANLGDREEDEYFNEGIANEIILKLAKAGGLLVLSRSSTARFRGSSLDSREIGRRLGVGFVLEGGVQRAGDRCHLTASLVDVGSGFTAWADEYEVSLGDIFEVQHRVASQIADRLSLELSEDESSPTAKAPTTDLEAFEAFLEGKHAYYKFTETDNRLAIRLFERALELDPSYAQAHAGLASAHVARVERGWETDTPNELGVALASCATALRQNSRVSEAYSSRGLVFFLTKRFQEAEADVRRSLSLDPSNDQAHNLLGRVYFIQGELERAEIAFKTALEINPFHVWGLNDLAWNQWLLGQDVEVERTLRRVFEISPSDEGAHTGLAAILYFRGEFEEALRECRLAHKSNPYYPFLISIMPLCLARQGEEGPALAMCRDAIERNPGDVVPRASLALVHGLLGRRDNLDEAVEKALELQHFYTPFYLNFAIQYAFEGQESLALDWLRKALFEGIRDHLALRRHPTLRRLMMQLKPTEGKGDNDVGSRS